MRKFGPNVDRWCLEFGGWAALVTMAANSTEVDAAVFAWCIASFLITPWGSSSVFCRGGRVPLWLVAVVFLASVVTVVFFGSGYGYWKFVVHTCVLIEVGTRLRAAVLADRRLRDVGVEVNSS